MTVGILAEKPSAGKNFAAALGGMQGVYNGENYVIACSRGHLYELKEPHEMVGSDKFDQFKKWRLEYLPWDHRDIDWKRKAAQGSSKELRAIAQAFKSCDEIAIATDIDPTGEGGLLAWEIIIELGLEGKKITRMSFTDEAPASVQKAFVTRKELVGGKGKHDEFIMAWLRQRWDLLSMQWSRAASIFATSLNKGELQVIRVGRLKTAMVTLVGDQQKRHDEYVKTVNYQNRFQDENGVIYIDPAQPQCENKADVNTTGLAPSGVTRDSVTGKKTSPPRMLDLARMSSLLSSRGIKASDVMDTYQKMYEAQVVSYPRTEDKHVTTEQFAELVRNKDKIASVIGVDASLLTHTAPRSGLVKNSGAHGANRPGPNIPSSMAEVRSRFGEIGVAIYELVARSALAILGEDYEYDVHKGHVTNHPTFIGQCSVPRKMGWKVILGNASMDDGDDENGVGLGQRAEPIIYEIIPKRPSAPTVKWLMSQLEKYEVGTGATRTSTFAEVSKKSKWGLMLEKKGYITLTDIGVMGYKLTKNTHIGDLERTAKVMAAMKAAGKGELDSEQVLAEVAQLVTEDIEVMRYNASQLGDISMSESKPRKEVFEGQWNGELVVFAREWSGYRFTDAECEALCNGGEITIEAISAKTKKPFKVKGILAHQTYNGRDYVGFKSTGFVNDDTYVVGPVFLGVKLSDTVRQQLTDGEKVLIKGMKSKRTGREFDAYVIFVDDGNGGHKPEFEFASKKD